MTLSVEQMGDVMPHTNFGFESHKISVTSDSAPGVLDTPTRGLTTPFDPSEGMAVIQPTEMTHAELQERALVLLGETCKTIERERFHKLCYIQLARKYGCTNDRIGAEMGVTEAAVRMMLKRADIQ
jgi:hypothetical protein